jgi:hypothetical protein
LVGGQSVDLESHQLVIRKTACSIQAIG